MTWNDPKTWAAGLITASELNAQVSENVSHLKNRNKSVITQRGLADTTSASPMGSTTITTNGGDLMFRVSAHHSSASVAAGLFDIQIDLGGGGGTIYASSGTGTALSAGVYQAFFAANIVTPVNFCVLVVGIPAGTHTVTLTMSGTGATLRRNGYVAQFSVEEYGINGTNKVTYNPDFEWANGAIVTAGRLNSQLRDNLNYLFERNYVTKNWATLYQTNESTNFVTVNSEKLRINTAGRDIQVSLLIPLQTVNINASYIYIDVLVDDSFYISSLTSTPLTDGWLKIRSLAARTNSSYIEHILREMDEGWHTFELFFKSSTNTSFARIDATNLMQLTVEEIGIRA